LYSFCYMLQARFLLIFFLLNFKYFLFSVVLLFVSFSRAILVPSRHSLPLHCSFLRQSIVLSLSQSVSLFVASNCFAIFFRGCGAHCVCVFLFWHQFFLSLEEYICPLTMRLFAVVKGWKELLSWVDGGSGGQH